MLDFSGKSAEEIIEVLEGLGDVVPNQTYQRELSPEELEDRKRAIVETAKDLLEVTAEKKQIAKQYNDRLKELRKKSGELVTEIQTGFTDEVGTLYLVPDYATGKMLIYDADGGLVLKRALQAGERQSSLLRELNNQRLKDGTND
jgi:predicted Rdx family selenoprotein